MRFADSSRTQRDSAQPQRDRAQTHPAVATRHPPPAARERPILPPMPRPTIAITCSVGDIRSGDWDEHAAFSPIAYVRAVQRAGARAILLVPDEQDAADPRELLATIDGVILSGGGSDVAPHQYGQPPHEKTAPEEPGRDAFELALAQAAREQDIPLLGICRGMQLLNVAYGGTLHQHLPDVLAHDEHRVLPAEFARHRVRIEPGSLAAAATGTNDEAVLSHHHQGPDDIGDGLSVTGRARRDDSVEAIEDPAARFLLGVLWHPEEDERSRVVATLVDAAREPRRA
jgi:putative glutamine amidotransferase